MEMVHSTGGSASSTTEDIKMTEEQVEPRNGQDPNDGDDEHDKTLSNEDKIEYKFRRTDGYAVSVHTALISFIDDLYNMGVITRHCKAILGIE